MKTRKSDLPPRIAIVKVFHRIKIDLSASIHMCTINNINIYITIVGQRISFSETISYSNYTRLSRKTPIRATISISIIYTFYVKMVQLHSIFWWNEWGEHYNSNLPFPCRGPWFTKKKRVKCLIIICLFSGSRKWNISLNHQVFCFKVIMQGKQFIFAASSHSIYANPCFPPFFHDNHFCNSVDPTWMSAFSAYLDYFQTKVNVDEVESIEWRCCHYDTWWCTKLRC